ncbi:MAG: hypothetical protein IPF93_14585 [Saprospiraceae bacterium]|nr:hypothetical protein [Saprospiraceae bacterium]
MHISLPRLVFLFATAPSEPVALCNDHQLFGGETWLDARYSNWGFDFGIRMDFYQNSNLINPQASFNQQGIGRWFVKKSFSKLGFEAGYIYDQIGSGILYRAYEQRNLGLDNALYGLKLNYDISPTGV